MANITQEDVDIMARTIYGEARGEPYLGKIAVGHVILNRAKQAISTDRKQFGDGSIFSACRAPLQFSCWNSCDPNCEKIKKIGYSDPLFLECLQVALTCILGFETDPTKGCNHYWAINIDTPKWAVGKQVITIGKHNFTKA